AAQAAPAGHRRGARPGHRRGLPARGELRSRGGVRGRELRHARRQDWPVLHHPRRRGGARGRHQEGDGDAAHRTRDLGARGGSGGSGQPGGAGRAPARGDDGAGARDHPRQRGYAGPGQARLLRAGAARSPGRVRARAEGHGRKRRASRRQGRHERVLGEARPAMATMITLDDGFYLDAPVAADAPAVAEYLQERQIYENTLRIPWPYGLADAQAWLAAAGERDTFAIREPGARLIGATGFHDVVPAHRAELGYWL